MLLRQRKKTLDRDSLQNEEEKEPLMNEYREIEKKELNPSHQPLPPPVHQQQQQINSYYSISNFISYFWNYVSQFWTGFIKIIGSNPNVTLPAVSPIVKQRMSEFQKHIAIPFNKDDPSHHEDLVKLWNHFFPSVPFTLNSSDWKLLGFQSDNPLSDFRASGIFGLKNILYFAEKYPTKFKLLVDIHGSRIRSGDSYPFAIASFNITMMICELLGWGWKNPGVSTAHDPTIQSKLISMLFMDNYSLELAENVFSELYCLSLVEMDGEWFESKAGYMDFPVVKTNSQGRVEKLLRSFSGIEDLFSHNLLNLNIH